MIIIAALTIVSPQYIKLSGILNFYTVSPLCKQAREFKAAGERVVVDLAEVTQADSAALLVILALLRVVEKQEQKMLFTNLPVSIRALMRLYDLEKVIPHHIEVQEDGQTDIQSDTPVDIHE